MRRVLRGHVLNEQDLRRRVLEVRHGGREGGEGEGARGAVGEGAGCAGRGDGGWVLEAGCRGGVA